MEGVLTDMRVANLEKLNQKLLMELRQLRLAFQNVCKSMPVRFNNNNNNSGSSHGHSRTCGHPNQQGGGRA